MEGGGAVLCLCLGFRVSDLGCGVEGVRLSFWVHGSEVMVQGVGFTPRSGRTRYSTCFVLRFTDARLKEKRCNADLLDRKEFRNPDAGHQSGVEG